MEKKFQKNPRMYWSEMTLHFVNITNMHFQVKEIMIFSPFNFFQIDPMAHKVIVGIVNDNHHWMLVVRRAALPNIIEFH